MASRSVDSTLLLGVIAPANKNRTVNVLINWPVDCSVRGKVALDQQLMIPLIGTGVVGQVDRRLQMR
jgi:hypothetical protein